MPEKATEIGKKQSKWAAESHDALMRAVRLGQAALFERLLDWTDKIETDGRQIKFTARNLGKVGQVLKIVDSFFKSFQKTVMGFIRRAFGQTLELNKGYFADMKPAKSVEDEARRVTLLRWGFDVDKNEMLPGGYFQKLFSSQAIAQRIAEQINRAMAMKMPLGEFRKLFRSALVGRPGSGMLERYFNTNTFDLFQRLDRSVQNIYAERLGLNYAVYSGTIMDTTRPFCEARVNKVFDRKEIAGWANLQFAGKPKMYDPFMDCGGHNCRHHLSWVSDEVAKYLLKT
jgi:hypothetical protein